MEAATELTPEQRLEALMPGVSSDTFCLGGVQFQLRQLPIFYERVLVRLVGKEWDEMNTEAPISAFAEKIMEKIPAVVSVILYEQGHLGAKREEEWDPSKCQEITRWVDLHCGTMELWELIKRQLEKNRLGDLVEGFLAQGKAKLAALLSMPSS